MFKVAYVLVSSERDLYYEQALLSIFSLKKYNPTLPVILLVDDKTEISLKGRRVLIREYVSEIIIVDVPTHYSPKERSRYIKTNLRCLLKGDILFIDSDTIIVSELSNISSCESEIACVLDFHAPLNNLIEGEKIKNRISTLFHADISKEIIYFNSGVIYMRDTQSVHDLFKKWHHYWKISAFEYNQCYDQPALMMANLDSNHIISELDGSYNCQILTSFQYLSNSRIIHFFNNQWEGKEELSPFFQENTYLEIKKKGFIPEDTIKLLDDPKSTFISPSYFTPKIKIEFLTSTFGATMYSIYKHKDLSYKFLSYLCKVRFNLIKKLSKFR